MHDQDARYNGSAVPELPCGGSDPARVGTVGCQAPDGAHQPPWLCRGATLLRRHLGRRWAATGPQSSSVYFVLTTQVNGMPAFRHQLVPGTQLRFDGEWKVRHTHRQPPSLPLTALGLA